MQYFFPHIAHLHLTVMLKIVYNSSGAKHESKGKKMVKLFHYKGQTTKEQALQSNSLSSLQLLQPDTKRRLEKQAAFHSSVAATQTRILQSVNCLLSNLSDRLVIRVCIQRII